MSKTAPSADEWLKEARASSNASQCGMFLIHNGVVRETARAKVRLGVDNAKPVTGMNFSYNAEGVNRAVEETYQLPGIHYVRTWLNEGFLKVGDDIMMVLIGGDIRPHVVDALNFLVGKIKSEYVNENEMS